jgi:hypothetical protein
VIWVGCEADYFFGGDWTGQISLKPFAKFGWMRGRRGPLASGSDQRIARKRAHNPVGLVKSHPAFAVFKKPRPKSTSEMEHCFARTRVWRHRFFIRHARLR